MHGFNDIENMVTNQQFAVMGTQYCSAKGIDAACRVGVGGQVQLVPEPDNPKDPNAIKVMFEGLKIGYVESDKTSLVAAAFAKYPNTVAEVVEIREGSGSRLPTILFMLNLRNTPPQNGASYSFDYSNIYDDGTSATATGPSRYEVANILFQEGKINQNGERIRFSFPEEDPKKVIILVKAYPREVPYMTEAVEARNFYELNGFDVHIKACAPHSLKGNDG